MVTYSTLEVCGESTKIYNNLEQFLGLDILGHGYVLTSWKMVSCVYLYRLLPFHDGFYKTCLCFVLLSSRQTNGVLGYTISLGGFRNGAYEGSEEEFEYGSVPDFPMLVEAAVKDDGITININGKYLHKFKRWFKLTPRIGPMDKNYGEHTTKFGSFLLTAG